MNSLLDYKKKHWGKKICDACSHSLQEAEPIRLLCYQNALNAIKSNVVASLSIATKKIYKEIVNLEKDSEQDWYYTFVMEHKMRLHVWLSA